MLTVIVLVTSIPDQTSDRLSDSQYNRQKSYEYHIQAVKKVNVRQNANQSTEKNSEINVSGNSNNVC